MNSSFGWIRGNHGEEYWPSLCPMFGLEGSKRHILEHGVILREIGFGVVGWFDDDLAHFDEV